MMRQNTINAMLLGMTAVTIGTSGSLPEQNPFGELNSLSNGTGTRNISSLRFNKDQTTLQIFGAAPGDKPQSSTRLASFVKDGEKPEKYVERKPFPRKRSGSTEDFDNFEDSESTGLHWKVSGNSWANSATLAESGAAFNRRYSTRSDLQFLGFEGRSFALTANVSTKEQSKATSDDFTINTDRITFRIAGGANKEQTSFKLVIDDKPVFVATGENDFTFRSGEFSTAKYKGKKGRFEIMDASRTQSAAGLIGVDDIRGVSANASLEENRRSKDTIIGDSYFVNSDEVRDILTKFASSGTPQLLLNPPKIFGIGRLEFEAVKIAIGTRMIQPDMDHRPGRNKAQLAKIIQKGVNEVLKRSDIDSSGSFGQFLLAQGIWVALH